MLEGGGYARAPASARRLLEVLPPSNWLSRNKQIQKGDLQHFGDSGVWDLLLHHCDRAYRVPDLVRLTHAAGLKILSFAITNAYTLPGPLAMAGSHERSVDHNLRLLRQAAAELEPLAQVRLALAWIFISEFDVGEACHRWLVYKAVLSDLPSLGIELPDIAAFQASLAELIYGSIGKHVFYVGKATAPRPLSLLERLRDIGGVATLQRRRQQKRAQQNEQDPPLLTVDEAAELVAAPPNNIISSLFCSPNFTQGISLTRASDARAGSLSRRKLPRSGLGVRPDPIHCTEKCEQTVHCTDTKVSTPSIAFVSNTCCALAYGPLVRVVCLRYVSQHMAQTDGELSVPDQESESTFSEETNCVCTHALRIFIGCHFALYLPLETVTNLRFV